jgi:hypothetical protein
MKHFAFALSALAAVQPWSASAQVDPARTDVVALSWTDSFRMEHGGTIWTVTVTLPPPDTARPVKGHATLYYVDDDRALLMTGILRRVSGRDGVPILVGVRAAAGATSANGIRALLTGPLPAEVERRYSTDPERRGLMLVGADASILDGEGPQSHAPFKSYVLVRPQKDFPYFYPWVDALPAGRRILIVAPDAAAAMPIVPKAHPDLTLHSIKRMAIKDQDALTLIPEAFAHAIRFAGQ